MEPVTSHAERGRLGGLKTSATTDGRARTARARQRFYDSFLDQVDPTGELRKTDPAEAERRATAARRYYYSTLNYKSVMSRRRAERKSPKEAPDAS